MLKTKDHGALGVGLLKPSAPDPAMRPLTPLLAASTLILAMAACSPKPEAASADPAPTEGVEAADSGIADPTTAQPGDPAAQQDLPVQDRPQGIPADPDRPMRPRRDGMDGPTTLADMQARADRGFARMDANGDGVVTTDELGDGEGRRGGRMLERADANGDGRVTRAELTASTRARFAEMDANGDGKVTEEERPQYGPR